MAPEGVRTFMVWPKIHLRVETPFECHLIYIPILSSFANPIGLIPYERFYLYFYF